MSIRSQDVLNTLIISVWLLMGCIVTIGNAAESTPSQIPVKSGETIAFMGDSITAAGKRKGGYCQLVLAALKDQGIDAKPIFAGISGHKSNQMLARLDKDVLEHKPDWMTLSCGVNDVWHGKRGVDLESYKKNITAIVDRAQATGVKVMLLTSTMIGEDQSNARNQKLQPYNEFIRTLAKEKKCLLADLNADMQAALKTFPADAPKGKQLTSDGVHMNKAGNIMMARGVAKAFGLTDEQFNKSAGLVSAQKPSGKSEKVLVVDKQTPKLEVRHSQIGFRDTLLFYTFKEQNAVLKLQIGNKDKTFPMTATFYFFQDTVTEEGIKKWLNNQHSDGLFVDVPEPTVTHKAPAGTGKVTSHKSIGRSKQPFGEYENYAVTFKVNDYSDKKSFKLKGFTGETKVHVKTK